MSQNLNPPHLMQQLSVGNVVNVTLNLYRANFKLYLKLSSIAYLWLLVPLYGWAKFFAVSALISRLGYCELMGQPESLKDANRYIKPRTWSFLLTTILIVTLLLVVLVISFTATGLFLASTRIEKVVTPLEVIADKRFVRNNILMAVLFLIILILILFFLLACMFIPPLWLYSRFFITDLPLASENNVNFLTTLCRSCKLTKGYFWKSKIILFIAIVLFLPIELFLYFLGEFINIVTSRFMTNLIESSFGIVSIVAEIVSWGLTLLNAVMLMPFLQLIKAVVYYNLRLRREGLGLSL